jgi:hypothetical protein
MTLMKTFRMLLGAGLIAAAAGCIHHEETIYQDVERTRVEFENDAAARVFYETLSKARPATGAEVDTQVSLPIVFNHKRKVRSGPNVAFNKAVAECDTNRDGIITQLEADIFAEQQARQRR